jgi:urease accessory protein
MIMGMGMGLGMGMGEPDAAKRRRSPPIEGRGQGEGSRPALPLPDREAAAVAGCPAALYRLLAWLSPAFPVGAYSYSHGLEAAAAADTVCGRAALETWIAGIVEHGGGRLDADILCAAHRAAAAGDAAALAAANRRGLAYRGTAELALESVGQGEAFVAACRAAWPEAGLERLDPPVAYAAAVGAAGAGAGIPLDLTLAGYLQAMAANLVSAGLRLGLVGHSDGQRILAALEPAVHAAVAAALARRAEEFGSAALAVDLAAMTHETQYSRLFRS